jgi:hypothetical protein
MVPFHSAGLKRAERIAACQAEHRKVVQIAFKPDWTWHKGTGLFKRNDLTLAAPPIGVIVFPGSAIVESRTASRLRDRPSMRRSGR